MLRHNEKKKNHSQKLIYFFLCFSIIAGLIIMLIAIRIQPEKNYSKLCSTDVVGEKIKSQFTNLDIARSEDLETLIDEIRALPKYENSPTCLYIVAEYQSSIGSLDLSANTLEALLALHEKNGEWIDPMISTEKPEDIMQIVKSYRDSYQSLMNQIDQSRPKWTL